MFSRASAITAPGIVLSQPTRITRPSKPLPRATSSIESAITSRLTSEARIPSVPIVMPSEIDTVLNSIGVPPAARTPAFTCTASSRRCRLQGPISIQVLATPMSGLVRSASEKPAPLSIARAAARCGPVVSGFDPNVITTPPRCGQLLAALPARVGAEHAQHRRELGEVRERAGAAQLVARRRDLGVEQIFPGPAGNRTRLQLQQVDVAQREDAQRLEERAPARWAP